MVAVLGFLLAALPLTLALKTPSLNVQEPDRFGEVRSDTRVPVQLGVMSRCPDALLCEGVFKEVLNLVGDKVDLSLVFVARIDQAQPGGVWCLHGRDECAGNVQQLCAAKYTPFENWWEFTQCENYQGRDKIGLPDTAAACAEASKIDWEGSGVGQCAGEGGYGEEGLQLLRDSINLGKELSISKSCTILISGRKVCVHDGTWKECEGGHTTKDFVKQIEEEHQRLNNPHGSINWNQ